MPRFNDIIQTFQNGEASPKFYGRTDFDSYKRSCRTVKNMIIQSQGGANRRVGTQLVLDEVADDTSPLDLASTAVRIIPFVVSETESYLIIFPGALTRTGTQSYVYIYNVQTGKCSKDTMSFGGVQTELGDLDTPFTSTAVLREMQYVQTGDIMYLAHYSMSPVCIVRYGVDEFELIAYASLATTYKGGAAVMDGDAHIAGWGFRNPNADTTLTMVASSAAVGSRTLTASSAYFTSEYVGMVIAIQDSGTVGWGYITGFTSSTVVDFEVVQALPAAAAAGAGVYTWIESAWNNVYGYPRTVALWNGRVFFGGTDGDPSTVWGSQVYDLFEMTNTNNLDPGATVADDDPVTFTVAADRANHINWMFGSKSDLLIGTRGREYSVRSFEAASVDVNPQTGYGSEYVQPTIVDDVPVYVQRGFRKLREMLYDDRTAGYLSPEVTYFAEHIPRMSQSLYSDADSPKIIGIAYQPLDNNILWAWDNNGHLFGTTKSRENSVNAFHRHELGGVSNSSNPPRVISACSVPSPDGTADELYLLVRRTINAATKYYIEKLGNDFYEDSLDEASDERRRIPIFADCAKVFRTSDPNATFYARLRSSVNADESDGLATGTANGTTSFVANKLKLTTATNAYVDYAGASNASTAVQTGCVRWTFYPTNVGTTQGMICITKDHLDNANQIQVHLNASGNIVLTIRDSAGSAIVNAVALTTVYTEWYSGAFCPHYFELNYDLTNGATRLFCNGQQIGATQTGTGTRNSSIGLIRLGGDYNLSMYGGSSLFSDIVIFDSVQHTEEGFENFEYMNKATTIKRLEYLEGQSVSVLGDGVDLGDFTVTSGNITLEATYDTVVVGLPYDHVLETQSIEAGSGIGAAQGRPTRVDTLALRFYGTAYCKFGRDTDNQEEINFRTPADALGDPVPLYTGDKVLPFAGAYDYDSRLVITGDRPLPCNITCLVARGSTYD